MEEKKSVKLKNKVDWKRVVKLSLISVALLLLVVINVISAVGGRDERADSCVVAYADSAAVPTGNELNYYFVIPSGTLIRGYDRCIIDNNVGCISLNLYLGADTSSYYRYSYAVWYRTNSIPTSVHGQPFLELSNNIDVSKYSYTVLTDFVVYFNSNIIDLLGDRFPNDVKLLSFSITYNSTSYTGWFINGLSNETLTIHTVPYYENGLDIGYQDGYRDGFDEGKTKGFNEGYAYGQDDTLGLTTIITSSLDVVHNFLNTPFFGDITLGMIFNVVLTAGVAILFLKFFAGG